MAKNVLEHVGLRAWSWHKIDGCLTKSLVGVYPLVNSIEGNTEVSYMSQKTTTSCEELRHNIVEHGYEE